MSGSNEKYPLISIIIPVYNILDYLERCVDSCINQTYQNIEILLIDDGSTDGTGELCERLKEKDNRIRVFHKENGGSSSARNLGLIEAKGKYVGFVDSDDYIGKDMYELLLRAIRSESVPIVQISRDEIDEAGNRMRDVCIPPGKPFFCDNKEFIRKLLLHKGDCSFCTKLFKRELFDTYKFPEGKLNEDFLLLLQMLLDVEGIYILPEQEYHVFYRIGSNTRKKDKNDFSRVFMDIVEHADEAHKIIIKKYPELQNESIRFGLFQRLDYMLHIPIGQMNGKNKFYLEVKKYLRSHLKDTFLNSFLTKKNKLYLILLTVAPKTVRSIHGFLKKL